MTGSVQNLRPNVRLAVLDMSLESDELEFIVDTGFTGYLTLPPGVVTAPVLPFAQYFLARLAEGGLITIEAL